MVKKYKKGEKIQPVPSKRYVKDRRKVMGTQNIPRPLKKK